MKVMFSELERSLSEAPQVDENKETRADQLKGQIDRLDTVLKKHKTPNAGKGSWPNKTDKTPGAPEN